MTTDRQVYHCLIPCYRPQNKAESFLGVKWCLEKHPNSKVHGLLFGPDLALSLSFTFFSVSSFLHRCLFYCCPSSRHGIKVFHHVSLTVGDWKCNWDIPISRASLICFVWLVGAFFSLKWKLRSKESWENSKKERKIKPFNNRNWKL